MALVCLHDMCQSAVVQNTTTKMLRIQLQHGQLQLAGHGITSITATPTSTMAQIRGSLGIAKRGRSHALHENDCVCSSAHTPAKQQGLVLTLLSTRHHTPPQTHRQWGGKHHPSIRTHHPPRNGLENVLHNGLLLSLIHTYSRRHHSCACTDINRQGPTSHSSPCLLLCMSLLHNSTTTTQHLDSKD